MNKYTPEILAPVGSFESLQAAARGGADAIYFGVEQLNMRTRSSGGLSLADMAELASICKSHHMRAYLTLNTVMYEHDLQLLKTILDAVKTNGIDAVIAADFAVIEMCNRMQIPLHISTQANISNIEAVQFYARFADVVVLARELTLTQVKKICQEIIRRKITGPSGALLKVEIFVHGALCMAISGKCYLSLHAQNASANRGACVQNCRRPYLVTDAETNESLLIDNEYIMSPKDLCCIPFLDEVIEAGVHVLKIEGRSKGADYVLATTNCYREAADAVINKTFDSAGIERWMSRLEKVYNRGFWDGYYLGRKLGEWTKNPGSAATEKKIYAAIGTKYYPRLKVGEFLVESGSIKVGDRIMILGKHFGAATLLFEELVVNGNPALVANKGDKITFPFPDKISTTDKLYKIIEAAHA